MIKFISIVGARPQFIKASVLSRLIIESEIFEEIIVHTGQHFDNNMSQIFFDQLYIPKPKYNLNINSSSHGEMTGKMVIEIEKILEKEEPKFIVVYGDTNSTLAGALSASKLGIPIVHVESGLRSYNRNMPEEINRVLTDHLSSILLTPNNEATENLKREGIYTNVYQVGDIMVDSFHHFYDSKEFDNSIKFDGLITIHRPSNVTLEFFTKFFEVINSTKLNYLFPIHPRTLNFLKKENLNIPKNITCSDPLDYKDIINALKMSKFVITDSGGLQKEAYLAKRPVLIMRNETEWNEIIDTRWGFLTNVESLKTNIYKLQYMPEKHPPIFGNIGVGVKIVDILKNIYSTS